MEKCHHCQPALCYLAPHRPLLRFLSPRAPPCRPAECQPGRIGDFSFTVIALSSTPSTPRSLDGFKKARVENVRNVSEAISLAASLSFACVRPFTRQRPPLPSPGACRRLPHGLLHPCPGRHCHHFQRRREAGRCAQRCGAADGRDGAAARTAGPGAQAGAPTTAMHGWAGGLCVALHPSSVHPCRRPCQAATAAAWAARRIGPPRLPPPAACCGRPGWAGRRGRCRPWCGGISWWRPGGRRVLGGRRW